MYKAADLVLLPFPFSDLSASKRRPVLILTDPDAQGDFVACPITSRAGWSHGRLLSQNELVAGTLPLVSWVRTDKVVTLHIGLIVRHFGRVTKEARSMIAADVCRFLDLSPGAVAGLP
jgi:mRNA interferase MazF